MFSISDEIYIGKATIEQNCCFLLQEKKIIERKPGKIQLLSKTVAGFAYSILHAFNLALINERIIDFWDYNVLFGKSRLEMVLKPFKPSARAVSTSRSMGRASKKAEQTRFTHLASPAYLSIVLLLQNS